MPVASVVLPGPLVGAGWLLDHLGDIVVAQVGWSPGRPTAARTTYEASHIPEAVFLDVDADLSGRPFSDGPGRHPLPSPERFAQVVMRVGVSDGSVVVAYDDAGGSLAARLWWMLQATGRPAAVLDGGLEAWEGPRRSGPEPPRSLGSFTPRPWPTSTIVDADGVARALIDGSAPVLDARAAERFRGETEPLDPVAGHIPGAVSNPWARLVDGRGRFLPEDELRARFAERGVVGDVRAIAHCGSGITACHTLLALRLAGLEDGVLYEGSWSDWVSDPSRPVATGKDD